MVDPRSLFDPAPGLVYLDSATYGLPPRPTVDRLQASLEAWQRGTADWVHDWDKQGEVCRAAFGELIGFAAESIALIPAVSVGVGTVAATLTDTDEVVIPEDEFTSVIFPILVAARERGLSVREVPFAQLADRIGPRTRLVAFSLVQSHSGLTADQASIMDAARRVGARTLIDATHAVPFVSVDPRADFVVCAAYKHLLCPRGVAFMVASRDQWDHTPPLLSNWRSSSNPYGVYYGGPLNLAPNAARFDVSLAWFPWLGAAVSLSLLVDWQIAGLLEEPVRLARRLARHLSLEEPCGTVLSVAVDEAEVVRANLAQAGIKAAVRAGSVRVSPHVYNTTEDVDKAAAALSRFVRVAAA